MKESKEGRKEGRKEVKEGTNEGRKPKKEGRKEEGKERMKASFGRKQKEARKQVHEDKVSRLIRGYIYLS